MFFFFYQPAKIFIEWVGATWSKNKTVLTMGRLISFEKKALPNRYDTLQYNHIVMFT